MNPDTMVQMIQANAVIITAVSALAVMVLFFLFLLTVRRIAQLSRRLDRFMKGSSGDSIEDMVVEYKQRIEGLESLGGALNGRVKALETIQRGCIQKTGLVRYNAFCDTGCDLSFSLALLDSDGSGVVLSSLYGRNESIMYAKPLVNGKSRYALSAEEQEAVNRALK
jgi:HAMP domain-containing protein